jgi:hypothetical protein
MSGWTIAVTSARVPSAARDSLELAKSRLGHLKLQDLTKSHWTSS